MDELERIGQVELEREALEMRIAGLSYSEIARRQDTTVGTARKRIQRAIRDRLPAELVTEARQIELARMDYLVQFNTAILGNPEMPLSIRFRAHDGLLEISRRVSKLLGLDSPIKHQVEVTTELDNEIRDLMTALSGGELMSDLSVADDDNTAA